MAKTRARKLADKLVRGGKLDPREIRGSWNGVRPVTTCIPNKKKNRTYDDFGRAV